MDAEIQGYLTEFGILRKQISEAIKGLSDEGANWHPLPQGTNSVYAILSHIIGADTFWIRRFIGGEPIRPDREADFAASGSLPELVERWERAWAETESIIAKLGHGQLLETRKLPFRAESGEITIQWALLHLLSHYGMHLGHLQLTRQLWDAQHT